MEPPKTKRIKHDLLYYVSRCATLFSILMYVSYIPQIMNNLTGVKGNPIQPLCATLNGALWVSYGLIKAEKDWPVIIANLPGIVLGLVTFLTAL
ncbi:SemiSWEET family transporter [Lactobacillus xylocopicola]|uniref:Membrane protein n=1 Tax=Lactobacillus xylocopicola TaxID=2976676 RepID=A0ABN6SHP0_9LACO|nr:SemiSWEET family transporter [Lactobacillus xylocopicola]BDR59830.1 membrane protein [Lactobacillus xylocopicola]